MAFDSPDRRLVGIAKLAAGSETLASKNRVEYFELPTRRYITRCRSNHVPFGWTVNPYRGCEFGCRYCYARYTHEFMELREADDFETKIFAKMWNPAGFREELRRIPWGEWIGIGTATDPYQPAERRYGVTRRMLEVLAGERGRRLSITTKSDLVARDIGVLRRIAESNVLHVAVSITTWDAGRARLLEPYAPRPDLRMKAVAALSGAGLRVAVLACPLLPLINDDEEGLERLAEEAMRAGAGGFAGGVVFLKPCTHGTMFPFLEESFPHLVAKYRHYFERKAFVGGEYQRKIAERLERVRKRNGLPLRMADGPPAGWAEDAQMSFRFEEERPEMLRKQAGRDSAPQSTCRRYAVSL
jgi:DNA repair photolyase